MKSKQKYQKDLAIFYSIMIYYNIYSYTHIFVFFQSVHSLGNNMIEMCLWIVAIYIHTTASYQPKHLKLCSIFMKSIAFYVKSAQTHRQRETETGTDVVNVHVRPIDNQYWAHDLNDTSIGATITTKTADNSHNNDKDLCICIHVCK